jgi:hypothetical protein
MVSLPLVDWAKAKVEEKSAAQISVSEKERRLFIEI